MKMVNVNYRAEAALYHRVIGGVEDKRSPRLQAIQNRCGGHSFCHRAIAKEAFAWCLSGSRRRALQRS